MHQSSNQRGENSKAITDHTRVVRSDHLFTQCQVDFPVCNIFNSNLKSVGQIPPPNENSTCNILKTAIFTNNLSGFLVVWTHSTPCVRKRERKKKRKKKGVGVNVWLCHPFTYASNLYFNTRKHKSFLLKRLFSIKEMVTSARSSQNESMSIYKLQR